MGEMSCKELGQDAGRVVGIQQTVGLRIPREEGEVPGQNDGPGEEIAQDVEELLI